MSENSDEVMVVKEKGNGLATTSMVLGIIAIVVSIVPAINAFSIIMGLVGLGLSIPNLKKCKAKRGQAIAGLILCILAIVSACCIDYFTYLLYLKRVQQAQDIINNFKMNNP